MTPPPSASTPSDEGGQKEAQPGQGRAAVESQAGLEEPWDESDNDDVDWEMRAFFQWQKNAKIEKGPIYSHLSDYQWAARKKMELAAEFGEEEWYKVVLRKEFGGEFGLERGRSRSRNPRAGSGSASSKG